MATESASGASAELKVGVRVRYFSPATEFRKERTCTGEVVAIYPGYHYVGDGTYDDPPVDVPTKYAVHVDERPDWWAYTNSDRFAVEAKTLTILSSPNGDRND